MRKPLVLLCGCILAAPCGAQYLAPTPSAPPPVTAIVDESLLRSLLDVKSEPIRFRAGDVVAVTVYGLSSFGGAQQRVETDGTIRFPFVDKVEVGGRTVPQVEEDLESKLKARGILQDPQVTVTAVSQPWAIVTISGEVFHPGVFPAFGQLSLVDYLSEAGGLQDNLPSAPLITNSPASSVVTLVRPSLGHPVSIPLGPDPANSPWAQIPLLPGDEIRVGRVGVVYAFGAFRIQGAYALKNTGPTTVLQLAAMAGGIGFEGDRKDAHVIRTAGDKHYMTDINVQKILDGKMADVALQPDDILFVPTNEMKAAIKGGGTGSIVSLASAGIIYGTGH